MPAGLIDLFRQHGYDAWTVPGQGLGGRPDEEVWLAVQREGCFLITMDLGFADVRFFPPGTHEGILVLRLSRQGRKRIRAVVQA
ncbi:MAG: DUF5615 family PIN-like protein, partial [Anaerolineae bacterium]|nr:DUF5615 family PIN-like protein [Anaerolineae bacterium]